jgi:hypothetical protein
VAVPYGVCTTIVLDSRFVAVTFFTFSVFTEIALELCGTRQGTGIKPGFPPKFSKTDGPKRFNFSCLENVFRVKNSGIWY